MPAAPERRGIGARLAVDRIACTGHGVCSTLLPDHVWLDEWGYPVIDERPVDRSSARTAVRMCPARALYLRS